MNRYRTWIWVTLIAIAAFVIKNLAVASLCGGGSPEAPRLMPMPTDTDGLFGTAPSVVGCVAGRGGPFWLASIGVLRLNGLSPWVFIPVWCWCISLRVPARPKAVVVGQRASAVMCDLAALRDCGARCCWRS